MSTRTISPLRQRMIDDMTQAGAANPASSYCKLQAVCRLSPTLSRYGHRGRYWPVPIAPGRERNGDPLSEPHCNGRQILFRVALRRHDLAAEMYHLTEPQKVPVVRSQENKTALLPPEKRDTRSLRQEAISVPLQSCVEDSGREAAHRPHIPLGMRRRQNNGMRSVLA